MRQGKHYMAKVSEDSVTAWIRDVQSWAPQADPALVEDTVHRAWGIMDADPYGISPIAFIGALLRLGLPGDQLEDVLRITEHLVASMADWQPDDDKIETYDA
jgi:hypothetical protein